MDDLVALTVRELGGVATTRQLLRAGPRRTLDRAVAQGAVVRLRQGVYCLPDVGVDLEPATRLSGVTSHGSAALWHGWSLKLPPELPVVTVPRHRKVPSRLRHGIELRYADLASADVEGQVTSPVRTDELRSAAAASPRTGRARATRVVEQADARAANAFESVVRAIGLDVPGLTLEPQVHIATSITPDLVDRRLRIVIECDSWTCHGEKSAFRRDLERYNEASLDGWLVLRINRDHAWDRPDYVRNLMRRAVDARAR